MIKKVLPIIIIIAFLVMIAIFAVQYNRYAQSNKKFEDFQHHYEDSINQKRNSFVPQ